MRWLRFLFRGDRLEHDLDRELSYHLDRRAQDLVAGGLHPDEARRQAHIEFGGVAQTKEEVRDAWFARWPQDLIRDLALGCRLLRRSPGFTAVAAISLALGIGANTAVFSLINAVLFRMMPVEQPDRLVQIIKQQGSRGPGNFSYFVFERLRDRVLSFEGAFAQHSIGRREIIFNGEPEEAVVELVSGNYHSILRLQPAIGRLFTETDRDSQVAVISHSYWRRRFASDPGVIGQAFRLNNRVFTIAGVTPHEFFGVTPGQAADLTFPLGVDGFVRGGESWLNRRNYNFLSVMARLRPDSTLERAQAEAAAVFAPLIEEDAATRTQEFVRLQIREQRVELQHAGAGLDTLRSRFSEPLFFLMGIVGLVLLLACANIANLLLVRAVARKTEISVRLAIGASRSRVVRQLLAEGLLLAALGGSGGLVVAYWFSDALVTIISNGGPRMPISVEPDLRVLAFAAAIAVTSCLAFALAPALGVTRRTLHPSIKEAGSANRYRLGKGLVVVQVAISAVLLVTAGLFLRTLLNLRHLDTGFERDGRVVFSLNIKKSEFNEERLRDLTAAIHQRLQSVPGVTSASFSLFPPISGGEWTGDPIVEGYTYRPGENRDIHLNDAAPELFRTLGTPVLLGREFTSHDELNTSKVAVVNEAFARYYYAGASPIGRRLRWNADRTTIEIVGMVKDVHYESLRQLPPPTIYFPASQSKEPQNWYSWILRSTLEPATLKPSIEASLRQVNPTLRVSGLKTLTDHIDRTILRERLLATLSAFFGALALALAALGLYGVLAFRVAARRREIGVRMALGAPPAQVLWLVFREATMLVLAGVVIGLTIAAGASKLTASMLFNLQPSDPATFALAAIVLVGAGALAAYLPARRATRLDPVQAIRYE